MASQPFDSSLPRAPALSLPKGDGSIHGLGEKVNVSLTDGSGSASIPIAISSGRGKLVPDLSLQYNSHAGNGPFGLGWSLTLPQISRKTDKGLPRYEDSLADGGSDVYVLSNSEDLVPVLKRDASGAAVYDRSGAPVFEERVQDGYAVRRYAPRIQIGFDCIERWTSITDRDDVHWRRVSGANQTTLFGTSSALRISDPAAEPGRGSRTFTWLVSDMFDSTGNAVVFHYRAENSDNVSASASEAGRSDRSRSANRHLKAVQYGNVTPSRDLDTWLPILASGLPASAWRFSVVFDYGEHDQEDPKPGDAGKWKCRSDPFSDVRAGFDVRSYRLCRRILMFHHFAELGAEDTLVRSFDFGYAEHRTGASLLSATQTSYSRPPGSAAYLKKSLPPVQFEYAMFPTDEELARLTASEVSVHHLPNIPAGVNGRDYQWVDLDGEGLPGILTEQSGGWYYARNTSASNLPTGAENGSPSPRFEDLRCIRNRPSVSIKTGSAHFGDVSGTGRTDVVTMDVKSWGYYRRAPADDDWTSHQMFRRFPNIDASDKGFKLVDLTGDGLADVLPRQAAARRRGRLRHHRPHLHGRRRHRHLPQRVRERLLGRQEAALAAARQLHGQRERPQPAGQRHQLPVWTSPLPDAYPSFLRYVDFACGEKPYLLKKVINNLGAETTLHYAPSTRFYLEDADAGAPWITHPPFPVHVVERKETVDKISGGVLSSTFRYHHGYNDTAEREFRGFARVDQWDTDWFPATSDAGSSAAADADASWSSPPVLTRSWFHTGAYVDSDDISSRLLLEYFSAPNLDTLLESTPIPAGLSADEQREACRALKGLVLRKEVYVEDGSQLSKVPYSIQQTRYRLRPIQPEQDRHGNGVYFVCPVESILFQLERVVDDPRVEHELVLDVDPFGNVTKQVRVAYGRRPGKSTLAPLDKQRQESQLMLYTEADYTDPIDDGRTYLLPHPAGVREYDVSGLKPLPNDSRVAGHRAQLLRAGPTPGLLSQVFQRSGTPLIADPRATMGGVDKSQAGYVDLLGDGSWWKEGELVRYTSDLAASPVEELRLARANFFTPRSFTDRFGSSTFVDYDTYNLYPIRVQNGLANVTSTIMDYRTLEPAVLTSPNGNRTQSSSDALGLPAGLAWMGKEGEQVGDNLDGFVSDLSQDEIRAFFANPSQQAAADLLGNATSRVIYDYQRYRNDPSRAVPVFSAAMTRETHSSEPTPSTGLKVRIKLTYSDGFGRPVQVKDYTKPGPVVEKGPTVSSRWVGSGWTIYNNKGQPVRQYENFFDDTHDFRFNMKQGVSPIVMYDPVGRKAAILHPDHTLESLAVPNAWSRVSYDVNDNVRLSNPRTDPNVGQHFRNLPKHEYLPSWYDARAAGQLGPEEKSAALKAAEHANTPLWVHLDALGRIILDVEDDGSEKIGTHVEYDIQGGASSVVDALGRVVLRRDYAMDEMLIRESSMDAGEKWTLHDINDDPTLSWNNRGFQHRNVYDRLRRRIESWVSEEGAPERLIDRITYGEAAPDAAARNLREEIWKAEDQAGVFTHAEFDFKKNLTRSSRSLWTEYRDTVDVSDGPALESDVYETVISYDALSRPVRTVVPDKSITHRVYNESQHLDQMFVNVKSEHDPDSDPATWTPIMLGVDYDAMYHTIRVVQGNGLVTTREFDPLVKRLRRILTLDPSNTKIQSLNYTYDPLGNVTSLRDDAQNTVFFRNHRVEPLTEYKYDALYRLVKANGREHLGQVGAGLNKPGPYGPSDADRMGLGSPGDGNAMGRYLELYTYDAVGNISKMVHESSDAAVGGWTRTYSYNEPSSIEPAKHGNRLSATSVGSVTEMYKYEGSAGKTGNMTSMPHMTVMRWNFCDQVQATSRQVVKDGTPETTYYVYDSKGLRVRKVTERQSGGDASVPAARLKETIYLKDYEVLRKYNGSGDATTLERTSLSASSEHAVVARIESRTVGNDGSPARLSRFQLTDMLSSSCVEADEQARIISYQEYHPFGSTSYQGIAGHFRNAAPKTYQFSGKERDEETGLYYHGARYYASWLGRWIETLKSGVSTSTMSRSRLGWPLAASCFSLLMKKVPS
ncbi:hypothetical protein MAPG_08081 [Magnaporthiopsis poae ATCC 64411]|uniref:SpvB domain-containing protein n=1 Tax=Magnaporthiopsis poae (strain ATCC 64411 / 73-15) TaxID=644358 RepID=A0A0C4E6E7_MAGP6|nr:hypothetical protein MAPG_08081 [Magnaporthiopsis poae ATCC 64411]